MANYNNTKKNRLKYNIYAYGKNGRKSAVRRRPTTDNRRFDEQEDMAVLQDAFEVGTHADDARSLVWRVGLRTLSEGYGIGHGGERQLHHLDIRIGVCVHAVGYDTRELLFPLLLDIQNTVLLLFRHQCDTALLPTLADNS